MKEFVFAFFGSFFPAVLFNIEKKNLIWAGISGSVGWIVYNIFTSLTGMPIIGTFLGAACIGFYSEIMARKLKTPASVFSISGIYPLVPGITAYRIVENIILGNNTIALNMGIETIAYSGAIAFGIMLITALMQFFSTYKEKFIKR